MMFGIPLPWILVGLAVTLFGTYRGGYHFGWDDRDKEMQVEIAKKNEEARIKEQKLTEQLHANATKLQETTNVINQKQSALDRAIRAGRVRFPAASCVQAPTNPTPATTNTETASQPDRPADTTSDADRATLQAIAEIVAQGDRNTAALNACVDSYNQMREMLNANNS